MKANLTNLAESAKRADAILSLIFENVPSLIKNETAFYAVASVQNEITEILSQIDGLLENDNRLTIKLMQMGIFKEVMGYIADGNHQGGAA